MPFKLHNNQVKKLSCKNLTKPATGSASIAGPLGAFGKRSSIFGIQLSSKCVASQMPNVRKISIFQSHYENSLRYDLTEKLCLSNSHETPKIEKIILSASVSFKPQQVRGIAATSGSSNLKGSKISSNTSKSSNAKVPLVPRMGHSEGKTKDFSQTNTLDFFDIKPNKKIIQSKNRQYIGIKSTTSYDKS